MLSQRKLIPLFEVSLPWPLSFPLQTMNQHILKFYNFNIISDFYYINQRWTFCPVQTTNVFSSLIIHIDKIDVSDFSSFESLTAPSIRCSSTWYWTYHSYPHCICLPSGQDLPWYLNFPMSIMILVPYCRKSKQSKQFNAISYPCTTLVTCDTQLEAVGDTELLWAFVLC